MDITVEDLQALTLFAQDPQGKDLAHLKSQLHTEVAQKVAEAILQQSAGQDPAANDPVSDTAKAIRDWVARNREAKRTLPRPELRERKKAAREWMTHHASAWQA